MELIKHVTLRTAIFVFYSTTSSLCPINLDVRIPSFLDRKRYPFLIVYAVLLFTFVTGANQF